MPELYREVVVQIPEGTTGVILAKRLPRATE